MHLSENFWQWLPPAIIAAIVSPLVLALIKRRLPSRGDTAEAKVDEATADVTASGAWQKLYATLQAEVDKMRDTFQGDVDKMRGRIDSLETELASLQNSLSEANDRVKVQVLLLQSVTRWALQLRDELLRIGGHVPLPPPEVEDALTNLSP